MEFFCFLCFLLNSSIRNSLNWLVNGRINANETTTCQEIKGTLVQPCRFRVMESHCMNGNVNKVCGRTCDDLIATLDGEASDDLVATLNG